MLIIVDMTQADDEKKNLPIETKNKSSAFLVYRILIIKKKQRCFIEDQGEIGVRTSRKKKNFSLAGFVNRSTNISS